MTVEEQIKADLKSAILNKDNDRKSILRVLIGEFNREGKEVADDKAIAIIKKMVQNAEDTGNNIESGILSEYLPSQLTENEIDDILDSLIASFEGENISLKTHMGKVMGYFKDEYSGRYDGKLVSAMFRQCVEDIQYTENQANT